MMVYERTGPRERSGKNCAPHRIYTPLGAAENGTQEFTREREKPMVPRANNLQREVEGKYPPKHSYLKHTYRLDKVY